MLRRPTPILAASVVALALLASACSSSDGSDGAASSTTAKAGATTSTTAKAAADGTCDQGPSIEDLQATPVAGSDFAWTVTSFDGTDIRANWFPLDGASKAKPAPTLLMGPGWSMSGDTSQDGAAIFGALSISSMHDQGYNVLTWDPRGFGSSTGKATVDSKDHEGRDVQALLDFVAQQPEAELDRTADPRAGMVGFSYGGGIQFVTAAIDCRVDALVPGIAWHSLETSLFKNRTVKQGWSTLLTSSASSASLDPHIMSAYESGTATGALSEEDEQWFRDRGPGDELVGKVRVPTLILQGTVDTLFTLDEAITNLRILQGNDVPAAMLWFCGGHGTCLTDPGDGERVAHAQFDWLARYLKGDDSAPKVPTFETLDQAGTAWTGDDYPWKADDHLETSDATEQTMALDAAATAGPLTDGVDPSDPLGGAVAGITPAKATGGIDLPLEDAVDDALVVGAPKLTLQYHGTTPDGERPTRIFAQLVDDDLGVVVGNQITPIEVTLDGKTHTVEVDLEVIAQLVRPGHGLTLQLVPATVAYATPRLGGSITVERIGVDLPVTTALSEG